MISRLRHALTILLLAAVAQTAQAQDFEQRLSQAAINLTKDDVQYDPSYFRINYPNGDVPANKGVCTDVIIRAYRKLGTDLQKEVHEDMKANFDLYPKIWGLKKTDTNIDHRRVPNLMTFFKRHGETFRASTDALKYLAGDIVTWDIGGGTHHIGIVVNKKSTDGQRLMVVHNIGGGQVLEDCLMKYKITGHFRYRKSLQ
jgi:uncharacterized protein YijF (DUF1287 family)